MITQDSAFEVKRARVWFVTGASTGLGLEIARAALARGDMVVATARRVEQLSELRDSAPERTLALSLDVLCPDAIASAVAAAAAQFGPIDVLVNNAGYGLFAGVEEASDTEARAQFDVNFFGLAAMTRAVLPLMRKAGGGTIVNMSSIVGTMGGTACAYYCASKFAVEGLSESLANEVAPLGIRVLIVEPGAFRTEFFGRSMVTAKKGVPGYEHLERLRESIRSRDGLQVGDPARAAQAILETIDMPDMPLRLVLGRVAFQRTREALIARLGDVERTQALAENSDYPASEGAAR